MIASTDITAVYQQLKTGALEKYFSGMNKEQKKAVFQNKGPLLILAGAGSGKTTVVVNRIANLTLFGDAYHSEKLPEDITADDITILQNYIDGQPVEAEMQRVLGSTAVRPWNILAITFTNKAAGELKERLQKVLGETGKDVAAGTFHWTCINILRGRVRGAEKSNLELLGYGKTFTIYDTDDSLRVIKEGVKQAGENDKNFPPRSILSAIGKAKDKFLTPKEYQQAAGDDFRLQVIGKVYEYYQKHLKAANAMDFDDIILQTVLLLENNPEVLEYYQNRYRYIMVDEYQDTNNCQYRLISLLSKAHQNLCVVGDDDQSIYKFRGATIENIMSFEKQFPNTTVVKLEQNYRCTQNILDAANGVISHNTQRKGKELWTENELGEKIHVFRGNDETEEGRFIADTILTNVQNGQKYSDHAILYRMNSQSNTIESCLVRSGIAYKIIGGVRFYERKEIKDIMAYLSIISNSADRIRLRRIINEP
ncbi:MAG: UvrD-helicase domain-containing protein, partial [Oscillospiraceae bacterium]